ncbi:coiled-coil domain-containing protein 96 [Calypte anna]|uniref:coiled-coil domain-containing protein 96 n=1 Tax=Calypte anna TaxID=9244 RepID=UPI0011C42FDA|nr:coiled-coil domain-containing protein 96 [Calypte anna]
MEEAEGGPGTEQPGMEGTGGPQELNMGAPGESPGPGEPEGPGEIEGPGEPAELGSAVPTGPRPEESPGPEEPGPEEMEPPGPQEPEEMKPPEPEDVKPPEPEKAEELKPPGPEEPEEVKPPGPEEPEEVKPPGPKEPEEVKPPGPEEQESCEPGEMKPPGSEKPEEMEPPEAQEPCEPEEPGVEEMKPPGSEEAAAEELSEPVVAEASSSSGTGPEEAAAASESPPAAGAEEPPVPPAGPERRSGEEAEKKEEEKKEEEEEEEPESVRLEREQLLEEQRELASERERLRQASARLQMRLRELLRLPRGRGPAKGGPGQELYGQTLLRLREVWERREREAEICREREESRRKEAEEREARARALWDSLQARKKELSLLCMGRRRRSAGMEVLERILAKEEEKEQRVREVRVENIKLSNEIQSLETLWKAQGELSEHQHVMDLENMKKENQRHSEKIDELSDEILKLKKKVSDTVNILSQFREKLQFVEAENEGRKAELVGIETTLSEKREVLSKTRQSRERLRRENLALQQKCGLLGKEVLLRDLEAKVDAAELLSQQLEAVKRHHAGLILSCRELRNKIKQANASLLAGDDCRKEGTQKK